MGNVINVLVFPCGAENGLEIHTALKDLVTIKVFGASGKDDHGLHLYKNYIGNVPFINTASFIEVFNEIIEANNINVVIPTHDDVVLFFAENIDSIKAKVAVPGLKQAQVCRSKQETYNLFANSTFCPKVYSNPSEILKYPVFTKPDKGQGGKGAHLIESIDDTFLKTLDFDTNVVTEYLPGEELTVDCFTDQYSELRFVGPRKRNRVFGGISVNSSTIPLTKEINNIAEEISNTLQLRGLWYFQLKKNSLGEYKLLEISVRTAGTMNLYRGLGVNFPLLTVYDLIGYDIDILANDYELEVDRALCNRYQSTLTYSTIYIDFDDTITRHGAVNPFVMLFLYNAKNDGKVINLITKHEHNLSDTLSSLCIHPELFDSIIQIKPEEHKYNMINEKESVFIDNSYKERVEVKKYTGIPVFDVDAIATLINWKE